MALFKQLLPQNITTLTIESTDLRVLTTRRGRIDRWKSVPLPAGLVSEGLITDEAEMGSILNALFTVEKLDRRRVITGLSGLRATSRMLTLPKPQPSLMEQAVIREARKEIPLPLENLYLSWQSIPGEGDQQRFYLLGIPQEVIDTQMRALLAAGIQPYVMDLKPLALIRSLRQAEVLIANLEHEALDVILVMDYMPVVIRSLALDTEHLDMMGKLDRLLDEIMRTVQPYDSFRKPSIKSTTPVCLTGSLLDEHRILDHLRSTLDRPVQLPISPLPAPGNLPIMSFITNLGLALKKV